MHDIFYDLKHMNSLKATQKVQQNLSSKCTALQLTFIDFFVCHILNQADKQRNDFAIVSSVFLSPVFSGM